MQVTEQDYILPGYYVQISGTVSGNGSQQRRGYYLNHEMVAFSGYGQQIHFGPDANWVGFGKAPLPAGVLPTPVASSTPLPGFQPGTVASAGTAVPPPPPAPAPVTTASPSNRMTSKAAGSSYQSFKTAGWTQVWCHRVT